MIVDDAVDCPVEAPALLMGLCGFLGDLPCCGMPRGAVIGGKGAGCDLAPCFFYRLNEMRSPHTLFAHKGLSALAISAVTLSLRLSARARLSWRSDERRLCLLLFYCFVLLALICLALQRLLGL